MAVELPIGNQAIFRALQAAGVTAARPLRNIPWITLADDGTTVVNIWRSQIEARDVGLVAVISARDWSAPRGAREQKRQAVVAGLEALDGQAIRVVILEERVAGSRKRSGARYDDAAKWLVQDTGEEFLLFRNRRPVEDAPLVPPDPKAFGRLLLERREVVSRRIERDARVRAFTLSRARNRCEIPECIDTSDFVTLDVHHMTRLGDGGADHTDNTVALCPACHARAHRGTDRIQERMERELTRIRSRRMKLGS